LSRAPRQSNPARVPGHRARPGRNPLTPLLVSLRVSLVVTASLGALGLALSARAQQSPATSPSPDSAKLPAARQPYEDRVMQARPESDVDLGTAEYNTDGWPRGISLQLTRNLQTTQNPTSPSGRTRVQTQGVQIDGFVETPNLGTFSVHALALGGRNASGLTSWSLRQSGMPFDGGWRADNALGTTNLLVPELARRNSRLSLPSPQVLGGSTVWRNDVGNLLSIGASTGEPGRFEGFPQARFVGSGGQVTSLFAQSTQGEWTVAGVMAHGSDILPEAVSATDGVTPRINPRGLYLSAAKEDARTGTVWQLSTVGSRSSGSDTTGVWADVTWRDGANRHQTSLYRFDEGLSWIDRPLAADLQGGSYRYDHNSLRWDLSANLETFSSLSGRNPSGWYASTSTRRQLSSVLSIGGGFAARSFGATAASGFGYVQWQNSLGVSRVQLDATSTEDGPGSRSVTLDHSLYSENGLSLSTTLTLERLLPGGSELEARSAREHALSMGLNGRAELPNNMSVQGSLRARDVHGNGPNSGTTVAANISLDWQLSRDWSFGMSFYENRGALVDVTGVQSPLVIPETIRTRPSDRGIFFTLRYGSHAGTPSVPLGGMPGGGAGRLEGSVFLDANGNGLRDGNESGAANILVVLDGKFTTRTNAFGAFEYPNVASGPHVLTVLQDELPLSWTIDTERKITARVSTRETTHIDIGAKRR